MCSAASTVNNLYVLNTPGQKISIRHDNRGRDAVVIIAPGFLNNKDTATFKRIANDLAEHYDVIAMDFRGHGHSEGEFTFSAFEYEDLKAVVDYARQHYTKVGVIGFSLGSASAIIENFKFHNIDSLICVSTPKAFDEIDNRWWSIDALRFGIENFETGKGVRPGSPFMKKIKPIDALKNMAQTPILFIHGEKDPTIDKRHSQELCDQAKSEKKLIIFSDSGHAEEIYRKYPKEFMVAVCEWFDKTMRGAS